MAARRLGSVRPPRALCLDLDDTLLDSGPQQEAIVRTCREVAAVHAELDGLRLVEANGKVWESYWPEIGDRWTLGALDSASVSLEAWRRTLRTCGCTDESVAARAAQMHARLEREAYRLFDDVHEFVAAARGAELPLALITNGHPDMQRSKLGDLGMEPWFRTVVISGEVGLAKPDTAIFALALSGLGVEREGVWHVGDNLATDVAGAQAAGLTGVWINRTGALHAEGDREPDVEIRSLSELIPLLAAAGGRTG